MSAVPTNGVKLDTFDIGIFAAILVSIVCQTVIFVSGGHDSTALIGVTGALIGILGGKKIPS